MRNAKNKMDSHRRQRLEALPGWSWQPKVSWQKGFSYLKEFAEREGHSRVPQSYKTNDDYSLGTWVNTQRSRAKKNKLASDRRQHLEVLPGWSWRLPKGKKNRRIGGLDKNSKAEKKAA
jgi:hypothetical protein